MRRYWTMMTVGLSTLLFVGLAWSHRTAMAQSQSPHVCGGGPGPDESMAGMDNGTPLCWWNESAYARPQAPQAPPPPIQLSPLFGAFVGDLDSGGLFWSFFAPTSDNAVDLAMASCRKGGGKRCESFGWFNNQCGAIATDPNGKVFTGYAITQIGAAREAMKACNATEPLGTCGLKSMPICSNYDPNSPNTSFSQQLNDQAARIDLVGIERFSADADDRDYWGALAVGSDGSFVTATTRSSRDIAERDALAKAHAEIGSKCPDCRIGASFHNACVAIAWPDDDRPALVSKVDADPDRAFAAAKGDCDKKYAACVAYTVCSSRRLATNAYGPFRGMTMPKKGNDGKWTQ